MPRRHSPRPVRPQNPKKSFMRRRVSITPFTKKNPERVVTNRLAAVMEHIQDYYIEGASHFAKDAGVSRSALSRLLRGESSPSYALVCALTKALEQKLGHRIDPRELISVDGTFLTPSVCELVLCNGCLPDCLYDEQDRVKPEYRHIRSGHWSREASLEGDNLIAVEQEQEAL